ncbi:hypothetical protein GLOIN_2v1472655 [Rhizophagus irregularis DAOM 181602=DAOM 197198]|uniref:TLDc domain-containing protein n=1 Tax=Rhizophagus irregularis (strain DAOM 181602 / DAOM 197198 / MUCL 43194) TaxID=747089 RepID=A0A2P4QMV7_RHIID|nr:hypothetical protein GLOIN_2v1472655 [Rhizophagus irregularis DAOM 181602=DAOM 197198]POG78972.1 hypothetical protein GLOIN_2v1472655 [Rhizophagus irregularis DAOM 181602=DAOM 197198]|eukprot:XP_025185838.1 hypothetical protein GLOIN_2v1472655 [Rhizophagus irregularis DAOM 181602=DAOM 197198]
MSGNFSCVRKTFGNGHVLEHFPDARFWTNSGQILECQENVWNLYLYCGQLDLSIEKGSDILKLLVATEELGLNILNEFIQEFLIEYLQNTDPLGVLELVFQHKTFTNLKDSLLEIICHEPKILFGTDKILSLPAQILESLLKREDLVLDEIEIWDNLTKWAHAQQPTVDKNPFEWTKNELALMERTLLKLIPLIRFHDITSKAYYEKVIPYEDLFPKKLRLEIMKFYLTSDIKQIGLLPSRSFLGTIDSVIINKEYIALFTGWIDKKEAVKETYKFNLIFRANRDGDTAASFHAKCNDKGATIVVAKIKGSNKVVGGYNPLDWNGNGDKSTPDSFIFIFEDYNNICTGRIGRVIRESHAVRCLIDYGPLFGSYNRGSNDIMVTRDGKWSSVTNSYPNINIPRNFVIDDYEVFQVIKK